MYNFHFVYILESILNPGNYYTGNTSDITKRLSKHNEGGCPHTAKFRPWHIKNYFAFNSKEKALKFEKYLKSGSGREFARRHF
ncbi:MAG: GIY-YIG nuclease family protein [Candidatus Cloacimonetes bacterium]|nr:GIY-YIG nuclease family protein [Candidatus Cloacimonadota bacterium]